MELLNRLQQELAQLQQRGLQRRRRISDARCGPVVEMDGRPLLAFCSNDYLGLASHPAVVDALREGAARYGAGSGASHLISGHGRAHALLEERLAELFMPHLESPRALYFSSGYLCNIAVITALAGDGAAIFSETLNHASLIDGARLSRAPVQIFPHRDVAALEAMLINSNAAVKLVITDSVFSMDGDIAPLPALLALCEQHGAWLMVDDAHGFGVLGEQGRGALEHFNLRSPYLIYIGTLGKAAGVSGAFVAAHQTVIETLVQRARSYIYTTASAPALAHALMTSVGIITGDEGQALRRQLSRNIAQLRMRLARHADAAAATTGWHLPPSTTAIQPLIVGGNEDALQLAAGLLEHRLWVPAIRPPTVPANAARLRITLSAAHNATHVDRLCDVLDRLSPTAQTQRAQQAIQRGTV